MAASESNTPGRPRSKSTKPAAPAPATLKGLSNRLKIKTTMVRKIAIMDLIHRHEELDTTQVVLVLASHLSRESQSALQSRILDFLVSLGDQAALPLLQQLAKDEATDEALKASLQEAIASIEKSA